MAIVLFPGAKIGDVSRGGVLSRRTRRERGLLGVLCGCLWPPDTTHPPPVTEAVPAAPITATPIHREPESAI